MAYFVSPENNVFGFKRVTGSALSVIKIPLGDKSDFERLQMKGDLLLLNECGVCLLVSGIEHIIRIETYDNVFRSLEELLAANESWEYALALSPEVVGDTRNIAKKCDRLKSLIRESLKDAEWLFRVHCDGDAGSAEDCERFPDEAGICRDFQVMRQELGLPKATVKTVGGRPRPEPPKPEPSKPEPPKPEPPKAEPPKPEPPKAEPPKPEPSKPEPPKPPKAPKPPKPSEPEPPKTLPKLPEILPKPLPPAKRLPPDAKIEWTHDKAWPSGWVNWKCRNVFTRSPFAPTAIAPVIFRELIDQGLITEQVLAFLLSNESAVFFKLTIKTCPALMDVNGPVRDEEGRLRYATKVVYQIFGKPYYFTKEWWYRCYLPLMKFIEIVSGWTESDVLAYCEWRSVPKIDVTKIRGLK